MLPTLEIGSFVIPTGGLIYIVGAWLILTVVERTTPRLKLDTNATYGVAVTTLVSGLVGARLVFVATHWSAYQNNLLGIVWPLTSGFTLWAGLLVGLAGGFFYGRKYDVPPLETLDALVPAGITALMVVSLADFLAGPGYGAETTVFWGIELFGIRRHPVQIYELLIGVGALVMWWRGVKEGLMPGRVTLLTTATYALGRLITDTFRGNPWLTNDGFHLIQIMSLGILLVSLYLLSRDAVQSTPTQSH